MDINRLKNPHEVERFASSIDARHIGHELVLFDNIGRSRALRGRHATFGSGPVKVVGASIFLCAHGRMKCRINLSDHEIGAGEALVVLPGSIMQIIEISRDIETASISFATDYYEAIVDVSMEMRVSPVVRPTECDFSECINVYRLLDSRIARDNSSSQRMIAKGYISVICGIITDTWKRSSVRPTSYKSRPSELYARFIEKVQEDYHSHRNVAHYADTLCVTPKYLSMVVKKESGRNASDFIDELVIFEAKALLMDGEHNIRQVSEMMEFPNPSFFTRFFRTRTGLSPSSYKNSLQ